jgi:hypothetical protein
MLAPTPSALSLRMQGLRSAADEAAQERIDPAAQSGAKAGAIKITVAAEFRNVQCGDGLRSLTASNDKDPLLIRTSTPGSLSNIQTHTLGSSQSLITQLQICDLWPSSPQQAARKRLDTR